MKYIYYIIGIIALVTIFTGMKLSNLKVEVLEPALVINDRVISDKEFEIMSKSWSYNNHMVGVLEAIVTNQLLIQEAVRQKINKEESFRRSIENYYEQSLVKVLLDRQYKSFDPEVTEEMINRYIQFSDKIVEFTKITYQNRDDAKKGIVKLSEKFQKDFQDLSDDLKYSLFLLDTGKMSEPEEKLSIYDMTNDSTKELAAYRLDKVMPSSSAQSESDINFVRTFLIDQKKRQMFNTWMETLKKDAVIQILTDKI